ncbi:MAG: hypothetical protein AB1689_05900 [Thermodesulfobacteriota bacterium]
MLVRTIRIGSVFALVATAAGVADAQNSGRLARISATSGGAQVGGNSHAAAVSADGRVVAFQSDARDLVPNDTNEDMDIFVRDRGTGVVQRVSIAWNGMEARDDSECPAVSGDGRLVAFRSRAWNLYPGGANLGRPRWDVYVHDRQSASTKRISVARDGGEPDGDSGCPSISDDGQRVVFDSEATNLVTSDDNDVADVFLYDAVKQKLKLLSKRDGELGNGPSRRPSISGNGRVVAFDTRATNLVPRPGSPRDWVGTLLLRELATGAFERIVGEGWYPFYVDGDNAFAASLSADGSLVAFHGSAPVGDPASAYRPGVHVRDRLAGTTTLVSADDSTVADCGRDGIAFPCQEGGALFPKLSRDGRFLTFVSRSGRLLQGTQYHGDQVYLLDLHGGRLRRLSVDSTGWSGDSCSAAPVLSGDGSVLVYSSTSTNLVAPDTNARSDVFLSEWTCNEDGRCRELASCPAQPASCTPAGESLLRLRKHPPGGVNQDELFWRWSAAGDGRPFPAPGPDRPYQLCLYAKQARVLALDVAAPDAPACTGSARPCWKSSARGYRLLDRGDGVTSIVLSSDAGKRRIVVRGGGSLLDAPYLPLDGSRGLVVQLQAGGGGECWQTEFPASAITRNHGGLAQPGSRRDGQLVAHVR